MAEGSWLWIDQGGTFTDVVRTGPGGVSVEKRLGRVRVAPGPGERVRRGTTVATNALLERQGAPVALLTTAGFGEAPWIGDQVRPELFALRIERPPPLCAAVVEVEGRIGVGPGEGPATLLRPHRVDELALAALVARGIEAAAVVLVHGPLLPEEERRLGEACRRAGFRQVSLGHEVAPSRGFLARVHTTLADAALSPLLPRDAGDWMTSDGGLAPVDAAGEGPEWRGARAVLSGPAGGAVACAVLARAAGVGPAFGLDMGGTSTDVCRVDGQPDRVERYRVGGLELAVPAVRLHTIAAGGGSVLRRQGGVYQVGPDSAGSDPGPACHARGGPATVTDAEAVLGRLPGFPAVAGPERDQPLDLAAARRAIAALDPERPVEEVAAGFLVLAQEAMARAVRTLSASLGVDPRAHALIAFGGAGPGHACAIASALGIGRVLVPHLAGAFSALGIGLARPRISRTAPVVAGVAAAVSAAEAALGEEASGWRVQRRVALRHRGTSEALEVPWEGEEARLLPAFRVAHRARFGFDRPGLEVEAVEVRLSAEPDEEHGLPGMPRLEPLPETTARVWMDGWRDLPLRRPADAHGLLGPALILGAGCTAVLPAGWVVQLHADHLLLRDLGPPPRRLSVDFHPVDTAVFATRIMAVAEWMGERLARLARSVSIRERRDFSCAVFDAEGYLVANAPHVPVHLGAMGHTVRDLLAAKGEEVGPGTAWVSNDPYAGGSHLPDITVVMPVCAPSGRRLGLVACRGHHVDVGGIRPGSMPPHARSIEEEGLLLRHHRVLAAGAVSFPELPGCRQPDEVRADLEAQVAACVSGEEALRALFAEVGEEAWRAQLGWMQAQAEAAVRELLTGLQGEWSARTVLDAGPEDPVELRIGLSVQGGAARLSLNSPPHPGNLNAPRAVAVAVLLYVFRCLVQARGGAAAGLPLNDGALRPFTLDVREGGLFDPRPPSAVAGGNVETSQRLADALFAALGVLAAGQGTMNNLTVGFAGGAFYETIGGGSGAGPGFAGADGVQVHMTNTRSTDVEELEVRFPVRLLRHARRVGSGGAGRWRGGEGVVKEWELLAPAEISLLAGARRVPPAGLAGGGSGAPGLDEREVGAGWEPMPLSWQARRGDKLRVATPGGGGFGDGD